MSTVVTLGEIMMRLTTCDNDRFLQADNFNINYGGAEANVAVGLASFGVDTEFVTKLPDNDLGKAVVSYLKGYSVDTRNIAFGGERLGIYYLEKGNEVRPSKVIYDRKNSSMSTAEVEDFDFKTIFSNAKWLHISGITPAISPNGAQIAKVAIEKAKQMGLKISFDINFRSKLWTRKEASKVIPMLIKDVDVIFTGKEDAIEICGCKADENVNIIYEEMAKKYNNRYIVFSERGTTKAGANTYRVKLFDAASLNTEISSTYTFPIVDRVGAGDSMAAGMIYKLLGNYEDCRSAVEYAAATAVYKHTIKGDACLATTEEIETLIKGNGQGLINR